MPAAGALPVWASVARDFEPFFVGLIAGIFDQESVVEIKEPALYSIRAGGKRIRPALVILCSNTTTWQSVPAEAKLTAAAVECIHTYSLIHDDLPAMDDDDLRRGQPSCHRRFSEWAAILAGDTLNTFAFRLLADAGGLVADKVRLLADAAGHRGMAAGQALDLAQEKSNRIANQTNTQYHSFSKKLDELLQPVLSIRDGQTLLAIHKNKTAALMSSCCELGALCQAVTDTASRQLFADFGLGLGLLFQIIDDILDVTGSDEVLGKTAGKDQVSGKLTFPSLIGLTQSKSLAADLANQLIVDIDRLILHLHSKQALTQLVSSVLDRNH